MKSRTWQTIFLILAGIVIGALVSELTKNNESLKFLSFGLDFGIPTPMTLNLRVLTLTIGFALNITVSTIVFVILSVLLGRRIFK